MARGRVVGGKYELLAPIGRGGMSEVWLCRDLRLDKLWAIKEIRPGVDGAQAEANRRAILDEAYFIKRLDHPAIPRVVDVLEEGPSVFVVMDYVDGTSLAEALTRRGRPFEQDDVIDWGVQLCDVLGYLHGRRPPVVYRDLKPANVMLRADGSVKLVDFGIAEELEPGRGDDGRVIGSPGYSAPEQVEERMHEEHPTDTRADVYALGATLHSLVTGEVPRLVRGPDGGSSYELRLHPIREADPALSDGLERVLLRATRRDPDDRYQTIGEMRYDLEHHEELTQEHREAQLRRLRAFRGRLWGSLVALALGVSCLLGSACLRATSYEALVHEAESARADDPTGAERLFAQAADVDPSRMRAYEGLVSAYKDDGTFSPDESRQWTLVWQAHGQGLAGDARYARLCYDVGVLYLCYYDYLGSEDGGQGRADGVVRGQAAVENATRSAEWFSRAREACDPEAGDYRGLRVDDDLDEYAATCAYEQIGRFHTRFSQASREGRDAGGTYRDFWEGLESALLDGDGGRSVASRSEPMVQLRLCQVAFETIASPTYLEGLLRAGVGRGDAQALLDAVKSRVDGLGGFASSAGPSAAALYDEVEGGYDAAVGNVGRTYGSPVATLSPDGGEGVEGA